MSCIFMRHLPFLKQLILLIIILISSPVSAHKNNHQKLVLVTANHNQINTLQNSQVRKLFLNIPIINNNKQLIPLINNSDELLYEIFLQKIAYMSERNYERLLIAKTFRTGRPRPERYSDNNKLIKALKNTSNSVSIMWEDIAKKQTEIRIVQTLWEDRH